MRQLKDRFGDRLLHRTTRSGSLTDAALVSGKVAASD
jgi:DNA-binding transcriptional LysR family regulator